MKRNYLILFLLLSAFGLTHCTNETGSDTSTSSQPNFIVIYADDLGYGDLGVFGHPNIQTPNLDRMSFEGQKWTNFYVAAPVCTPSRAGLLTGRLPIRSGMCSDKRRVLFPDSKGGLPQSEITIARGLKENGYRTAAIGKWHLGHLPPHLPTDHGFDSYYGIPYSSDMDKTGQGSHCELAEQETFEAYNVPLMRDTAIIERPADQRTITKRYTEEAVAKIREFKDQPFFIYLAHNLPHIPLFRADSFKNTSVAGIYGDVIEEIDWSVGQIMQTLEEQRIDQNTLVVLSSDNGPWHVFKTHGGSAGMLRGAKGGTFEGGMRVPTIFWWPGTLEKGMISELGTTMDLLPTFFNLSGTEVPGDRTYDGHDLTSVLKRTEDSPREIVYYYRGEQVFAVRVGDYKAHFKTQPEYGSRTAHPITEPEFQQENMVVEHDPPLLYHLATDPGEKYNVAEEHPEVITEIKNVLAEHQATVKPVENQLVKR